MESKRKSEEQQKKTYAKIILGILVFFVIAYILFSKLLFPKKQEEQQTNNTSINVTEKFEDNEQEETVNKDEYLNLENISIPEFDTTEQKVNNSADLSSIMEIKENGPKDVVNVDKMVINDGSFYEKAEETMIAWAEGKQKWYKDKEGVIYIQPGTTFKMNDIEMTFGKKETIGAVGYGSGIFIVVPVYVKNTSEYNRSIMPNQVFYKDNVPQSCSKKIFQSAETFTNMLENTTLKPKEEKMVYVYMPFYGNIKTPDGYEEFFKETAWYENILLRYQDSQYVNVVIPYAGPISLTDDNSKFKEECVQFDFFD
jgi:hypothetical protein